MSNSLKKFLIKKDYSIKEAISKIKSNGSRTVIVVDDKNKLLGTLTEGDTQKALIDNLDINSKILGIYNKNPFKVNFKKINSEHLRKIFIENQFGAIPVINNNNVVKKIITWSNFFKKEEPKINFKKINVVIMAGGKGERLKPFTEVLPKPLIPINYKPMLEHILDGFVLFGFNQFHILINHQANLIKNYFNSEKKFNIEFIKEKKPLGTAGGLKLLNKIKSDNFLLANCDTIYKIDYSKFYNFHISKKNFISLAVSEKNYEFPYGVCKAKLGVLKSLKEKPKFKFLANAGLYFINKKILSLIKKNKKYDMNELLNYCLKNKKKIGVFKIDTNQWTDLGQANEFKNFIKSF